VTVAHYADYDACLAFARTYFGHTRLLDQCREDGNHTEGDWRRCLTDTVLVLWAAHLNHHLALLNPGAVLRAVDATLLREAVARWDDRAEPLATPALARALLSALYSPDDAPVTVRYAPPRPQAARKPL
jgi:hypothetical protein